MAKYGIVASDLDGTLLNNSSQVSLNNLMAINAMAGIGVYFVPSTGRSFSEIPSQIKDINSVRYFICSNGAVVFEKNKGPQILNCIKNKIGREILDLLTAFDAHVDLRHNGYLISDSCFKNQEYYNHRNVVTPHIECINNYAKYVDDFADYAYSADNVEVFTVFFHTYSDKMYCKKQLEQNSDLRVVEGFEYNLEIMSATAGKGNALCGLARMLNIDRAKTIGVGDSGNDISIIKAAGLGLAVSNATDSLKGVADGVICSNEEDAIAYILNNYL